MNVRKPREISDRVLHLDQISTRRLIAWHSLHDKYMHIILSVNLLSSHFLIAVNVYFSEYIYLHVYVCAGMIYPSSFINTCTLYIKLYYIFYVFFPVMKMSSLLGPSWNPTFHYASHTTLVEIEVVKYICCCRRKVTSTRGMLESDATQYA